MKFDMNIYCNAADFFNPQKRSLEEEVFNRIDENNAQDLYNMTEYIEDEEIQEIVQDFINESTNENLKKYITVEDFKYDDYETSECNCGTIAFLVSANFDIEKLLKDLKEQEENIER